MKLYVGNLSYDTTENELNQLFGQYGQVKSVAVITDRETGRAKGFAFVEFSSDQEAQAAIAGLDGKEVGGRTIKVNESRPQERSFGGNRGGGGGGWR